VDQRHLQIATLNTNDSVVALRLDLPLLIEDILSVLPATTNIAIVMGNSALEKFWVEELRRELQPLTNRIGFTWLNQLSFDQIRARAATLPPRSAIFYGQMSVDASGIPHPEESALTELHAVASAPIFGVHDYQLGHGIVGGPLSPVRELGRQTALAAGRILRGESPGGIRPPPLGPGPRVYDWRELRRWGIREARLPPGSEVRLREMTFWQRHSWQIALVTSALVAQAAIILQLLANQARRRRAEQSLVETERRFGAVADAAPVLIWMSGLDKLCTFFNKPWLDFTGRTLEQEMGNGWTEGVHADDLPRCVKTYVEAFDARRPFAMEYRLRRHDGEFRWISDTGAPRHDARGGFIGLRSRSPRVPMRMSNHTVNCVLLADRHHGLTEGVRGLLETAFDAVVMVADVTSLFESAERLKPTVAVVDVSIARAEGLQWLSRLRSRCPDVKLIVLSVHDEPAVCGAALEAGADAFVLKRSIATDLLPAIDAVQAGQGYVSPGAAGSPPTTARSPCARFP